MPNVSLIKDDGMPLILPASSITAVLSTKRASNKEHPEAESIIFTTFKASTTYFLAQGPKDVAAEIKAKLGDAVPSWVELPLMDDAQFIQPHSIEGLEGIKDGDERYLRVYFTRHDGLPIYSEIDFTDDLLKKVSEFAEKNQITEEN